MSNYDKIKDLIEKKKLSQGLLLALSNSLKIKLVTKTKGKEQVNNIETEIDLVKGLNTEINDKSLLSSNNYTLNFHKKQLENIYDTWDKNRETLVKIFQIINGSSIELHHSVSELNTLAYPSDDFMESDDSFENDFNDFESESALENSLFEEKSLTENPLNEEEDNSNVDNETSENWIDDLNNDLDDDIEDSFPQDEEDEENSSEENSFEMMIEEEDIFLSQNDESEAESVEESIEEDEDWDDFMVEMPEEEAVVSEVIASDDEAISSDVEMDDDWEEWLDEDNLPSHIDGEYTPDAIDWSEEN
ncbi:hypothetical protein [Geminocystis herdmanii]|uniref:hypothetical protein n=1 Tax=Geminocystis herdmanii TaxID=669359 RepID=UPI0003484585|nr:hypothetical protein [Geminocystis herdmanii]